MALLGGFMCGMKQDFLIKEQNKLKFSFSFAEMLITNNYNNPVFLCVGNSQVVGDLFGPLCGEILKNKYNLKTVYGNLTNNITSKNINFVYEKIRQEYPLSPIIVLDAGLGEIEDLGKISLCNYGCLPASKTNKTVMGNISILAKVNVIGISDFMFLKSVKYNKVLMAVNFVCDAIVKGLSLKNIYEKNSNKLIAN